MKNLYSVFILVFVIVLLTPLKIYAQSPTPKADTLDADSVLANGRDIYLKNCSACHGEKGQGDAGPNLTDKYWLHGGNLKNIHSTIEVGVSGKGMIGWTDIFSPKELREIYAYVASLRGTNPPKAKKPEGELFDEQKK